MGQNEIERSNKERQTTVRGYILSIWGLIDPIYYFFSRLTYPPLIDKKDNILRIRLTKYKGRNITLSDGTKINKNDILVKIHLHNVRLLKELKGIKSELKKAKLIFQYVRRSLPGVECFIQNSPHAGKIKGVLGITSRNKGSERLGFEIFDITNPLYKYFKICAFLPIGLISSHSSCFKDMVKHHQPRYLLMSTDKLRTLYGPHSTLKKEMP